MNYKIEDLLEIEEKLVEKYTSKESTSVTYERARILMEAILYCIHTCEEDNQLIEKEGLPAKDAYRLGYEKLLAKIKKTKDAYHEMIVDFCAYGNENYYDTVTKGIPCFFLHYDVLYAPRDTIITIDYPTICSLGEREGIDAIEKYVEYISYEQRFLNSLPEEYVCKILYRFQTSYRAQFYNICSIVLRHVLGCMLIHKRLGTLESMEDYDALCHIGNTWDETKLQQNLSDLLKSLIQENYKNDNKLFDYLNSDIEDFAVCLRIGAQNHQMRNVVVL